jgi:hypothetical protein
MNRSRGLRHWHGLLTRWPLTLFLAVEQTGEAVSYVDPTTET